MILLMTVTMGLFEWILIALIIALLVWVIHLESVLKQQRVRNEKLQTGRGIQLENELKLYTGLWAIVVNIRKRSRHCLLGVHDELAIDQLKPRYEQVTESLSNSWIIWRITIHLSQRRCTEE